jgi:hypothetical protein
MSTSRIRSLVSVAAALAVTLTLGGCASASSRLASDGLAASEAAPTVVRFDNLARDYVHVYLIGEKREWLLGRVEAGARKTLRIPESALSESPERVRLAVLVGQRVTLRAASDARLVSTLSQPATVLLSQQWTYGQGLANGQLTALGRSHAEVSR